MIIVKACLLVILNLILYTSFGALVLSRKNKELSLGLSLITGFFVYYGLFFLVCLPYMIKYRPLSWLTRTWVPVAVCIVILSFIVCRKSLIKALSDLCLNIKSDKNTSIIIAAIVFVQIILVTITYNFTLDAAYYVANVTTSVNTDMINVYDPFTGLWQDHYEMRYFLATYSINDAVFCQLFNVEALVFTKTVMSATICIIVNVLYFMICRQLFTDNSKAVAIMMAVILFVNMTFSTIFTSSLFLLTRTYEGKTVVGNLSILAIFYIYMLIVTEKDVVSPWLNMFIICVCSLTISSSANMILPGEMLLLFVPQILMKKNFKTIPKLVACAVPGLIMAVVYVLYIEGYFVLYTYPTG
ncbi:MAG: DUF6077 domain-containing protein [Lachnospiraceae bacterium]|nr:DUF6077 domain-containing protein [Lachnospiraceae bacterium]